MNIHMSYTEFTMPKKLRKLVEGQALLLVMLAMAAVMTVVLSVASRSITDVAISTTEEDALRAFSAAEAGIEKSLLTGSGGTGSPDSEDSSVSYTADISQESEGPSFKYPGVLKAGESATFWLVERTLDGGFTCAGGSCFRGSRINDICWGSYPASTYNSSDRPAVMLSVYYDWASSATGSLTQSGGADFTNIKVARRGYDPDTTRNNSNHFFDTASGTCRIDDTNFAFHTGGINFLNSNSNARDQLSLPGPSCWNTPGCLVMIKVRMFYNSASRPEQVAVQMGGGNSNLPAQGSKIESTGIAGESTRKVNVFQSFSEPLSIFDAAAFSLSDFSKN